MAASPCSGVPPVDDVAAHTVDDEECAELALRVLLQTLDAEGIAIEPTPEGLEAALAYLQQRTGAARAVRPGVVAAWRAAPQRHLPPAAPIAADPLLRPEAGTDPDEPAAAAVPSAAAARAPEDPAAPNGARESVAGP